MEGRISVKRNGNLGSVVGVHNSIQIRAVKARHNPERKDILESGSHVGASGM
jgi:hypothetical protein